MAVSNAEYETAEAAQNREKRRVEIKNAVKQAHGLGYEENLACITATIHINREEYSLWREGGCKEGLEVCGILDEGIRSK